MLAGATQSTVTDPGEGDTALSEVGAPGTFHVVAFTTDEFIPSPTPFLARTLTR